MRFLPPSDQNEDVEDCLHRRHKDDQNLNLPRRSLLVHQNSARKRQGTTALYTPGCLHTRLNLPTPRIPAQVLQL
jgi:hypothetical protein